jgi:hypothetical protein
MNELMTWESNGEWRRIGKSEGQEKSGNKRKQGNREGQR